MFRRMAIVSGDMPLTPATVTITSTRAGIVIRPWLLGRHASAFESQMTRLSVARLGGAKSGSNAFRVTDERAEAVIAALTGDGFTVRNNSKKAARK